MNHYDPHLDSRLGYEDLIAAARRSGVRGGGLEPLPGNAAEQALARLGACERDFTAASRAYAQNSLLRIPQAGAARKWFERAYKNLIRAERELERVEPPA